ELAHEMEDQVDIVAERLTSLGATALGTLQSPTENTILLTYPLDIFSAQEHIENLSHNFALLGGLARKNIKEAEKLDDFATGDLYIDLTRVCDKSLWFIEAHIQK